MERYGAVGADLLMSHFVSSEEHENPINAEQIARFDAARAALPELPASLANSSGMFLPRGPPTISRVRATRSTAAIRRPARPIRCAPSSSWRSRSSRPAGSKRARPAGYNQQWTAKRPHPARDAARRLRRRLAASARARRTAARGGSRDRRAPRSARRAHVDGPLHRRPDRSARGRARPGVRAQFFGDTIALDDFAARSGTIGYRLLTGLGPRYRRDYAG